MNTETRVENDRKKVSSKEYIDWIYKYVSSNKIADSEDALYLYKGIDAENGKMLGAFFSYVEDLAHDQGLFLATEFEEEFFFKIRDKYFRIIELCGQGTITSIILLDKEPDCKYVVIDS